LHSENQRHLPHPDPVAIAQCYGHAHLPVVHPRPVATAEIAERDGAASLVPPGNPGALAAALNELLDDDEERARLGEAAAAAAAGPYAWDRIAARTLDLYQSLLA